MRRGFGGRWRQREGDSFTRAYAKSLSHRLPLLYLVVVFDCVLMAQRFQDRAPPWLALFGPLALGAFALWRAVYWMPQRVESRSLITLRRDLRTMSWVGAASGFLFAIWAMMLYSYGDEAGQSF
ncbi:MAG: hypothetical protein C0409_07020, partial [Novosphingobium sp.]|nr:hypothetical protein [Novosphingobium sp.]